MSEGMRRDLGGLRITPGWQARARAYEEARAAALSPPSGAVEDQYVHTDESQTAQELSELPRTMNESDTQAKGDPNVE